MSFTAAAFAYDVARQMDRPITRSLDRPSPQSLDHSITRSLDGLSRLGRPLSLVCLAGGGILVFFGLGSSVGFSAGGLVASAAAIAALMYSGAVWFGAPPPSSCPGRDRVYVFDRSLREVCGPRRGQPVSAAFPIADRATLEGECWAALAGEGARFTCGAGQSKSQFDVLPVRTIDGAISYGILIDVAVRHEPISRSAAETF